MKPAKVMMAAALSLAALSSQAAELDPQALTFKLPDQIPWKPNATGTGENAIVYGDPGKPGLYVQLNKFYPHKGSMPHWHPNNRIITVIKGTWWVATGSKYNPDAMVAMPAGSVITHYGKQAHYDGARDEEVWLEIVGEGPATATPITTMPPPAN